MSKTYKEFCAEIKQDTENDYGHFDGCMAFDIAECLLSDSEFMKLFYDAWPEHRNYQDVQIVKEIIADDLCR